MTAVRRLQLGHHVPVRRDFWRESGRQGTLRQKIFILLDIVRELGRRGEAEGIVLRRIGQAIPRRGAPQQAEGGAEFHHRLLKPPLAFEGGRQIGVRRGRIRRQGQRLTEGARRRRIARQIHIEIAERNMEIGVLGRQRNSALQGAERLGYDTLWYPEGIGYETFSFGGFVLSETDRLRADQLDLSDSRNTVDTDLNRLIDRLQNRLGRNSLVRIAPFDSHIPERAVTVVPAMAPPNDDDWLAEQPRPIRLLPCPEPIEAVAPVPDEPPVRFAWRNIGHRVIGAEGPERIEPEWWRTKGGAKFRDYYRIEDEAGRRFWVFRDGPYEPDRAPRWYMHGLFA